MRVLRPVVVPSATLMSFCDSKVVDCGSIRFEIIRDELVWHKTISLQKLAHEFQGRPLVPFALDQNIKDFALGVDGAPQIGHAAIDFQIDFVEMPGRVRLGAASTQFRCDHWPEMAHPAANGLIGEYDPAFRQQILSVAKAQSEPEIEPDRLLDDFGGEPVPFVADFIHALGLLEPRPRPQAQIAVTKPLTRVKNVEIDPKRSFQQVSKFSRWR